MFGWAALAGEQQEEWVRCQALGTVLVSELENASV